MLVGSTTNAATPRALVEPVLGLAAMNLPAALDVRRALGLVGDVGSGARIERPLADLSAPRPRLYAVPVGHGLPS